MNSSHVSGQPQSLRVALPPLLAVVFAVWSFFPARDSLVGWGGDPLFNLWSFELVWHNLREGPLFWAPIYGGSPLGLAYSENQLVPGLLFWPLRLLTGNGALALGGGAVLLSLLAFGSAAGWLRALGFSRWCFWGGLLFAACGWLQSQYAHYQNLCVFVLPLALWAFAAYDRDPRPWRLAACAAAFGWIGAWNVHFQIIADACLVMLALRKRRFGLAALAFALQLPAAVKYAQLARLLGSYRSFEAYAATFRSVLGSAHRPRLVSMSFEVPIESAGYLGVVWLLLMLFSVRRRASRPWLFAALLAFWAALGPGYGLFDLIALVPGVSGLRAVGRAQVLVFLFSLPAVLGLLEELRPRTASILLGLAAIDLIPASGTERVRVDPALFGPLTPLSRALAASDDALLVLPEAKERFMLEATQTWTPYFGGFSGRAPPGTQLLWELTVRRPWGPDSLDAALDLTRPRRVLALTPGLAAELRAAKRLRFIGCYAHLDLGEPCLFEAVGAPQEPALRLDRDARWESRQAPWPALELRALRGGVLEIRSLDGCRLRQTLRFPHLPPLTRDVALPGATLQGPRLREGQTIARLELRRALFRFVRPQVELETVCQP